MKKSLLFAGAVLGAFALAASAQAATVVSIGLQEAGVNGGSITTVNSDPTDAGVLKLTYGTWSLNNVSGSVGDTPFVLTSTAVDKVTSNQGTPLKVYVSETGITAPFSSADLFSIGFGSNSLTPGWQVTEEVYLDTADGLYTTPTLLGTTTFTYQGPNFSQSVNLSAIQGVSGPYSITDVYTITPALYKGSYNGSASSNITVSATPEPAAWALLMIGVGGMGAALRTRRRKATLAA